MWCALSNAGVSRVESTLRGSGYLGEWLHSITDSIEHETIDIVSRSYSGGFNGFDSTKPSRSETKAVLKTRGWIKEHQGFRPADIADIGSRYRQYGRIQDMNGRVYITVGLCLLWAINGCEHGSRWSSVPFLVPLHVLL